MDSIRFTCQRGCINCCDQEGFVYLTEADLKRAAKFVGMPARAFEKKYKELGGSCTVILNEGAGHLPTAPKDPKAAVEFILSHQIIKN